MIIYILAEAIVILIITIVEFSSFTLDEETESILYANDTVAFASVETDQPTASNYEEAPVESVNLDDEAVDLSSDITAMADELINGVLK